MFGIADLITTAVINDGLRFLSNNPDHVEFILGAFVKDPAIHDLVGKEHIKQCVDFITQNRVNVAPAYQLDITKRPMVAVSYSGSESQQYLGDYGYEDACTKLVAPPTIYARFNAKSFDKNQIILPVGLGLSEKLWINMKVVNGSFVARITGIMEDSIFLDTEIPEGTEFKGWVACSNEKRKGYVVNSSTDSVSVQCILVTTGDYSVHRLLATVIRYCLKRGRPLFDAHGMQVATFNYSAPSLIDQNELQFETTFVIEAKLTDHWVEKEYKLPDDTDGIEIDVIFTRDGVDVDCC